MGSGGSATRLRPVVDPTLDRPGEPDHLVCCRGSWDYTLCGLDTSGIQIIPFSNDICPDCLAEAQRRYAELGVSATGETYVCVENGEPCPHGAEADVVWQRVLDSQD